MKIINVKFSKLMYTVGAIHREFISADINKDSTLSMHGMNKRRGFICYLLKRSTEIRCVLNHMDIPLEELSAKRIMDIFDINNDKVLNYGEFFLLYIFLKELRYLRVVFSFEKI
jgi:hypothetical protein